MDILLLSVTPAELTADGASVASLTLCVPGNADSSEVELSTTLGTFQPGGAARVKVQLAEDGVARSQLTASGSVGDALLTATFDGFSRTFTLPIRRAYPTTLTVDPGRFTVAPETDATITVTLLRSVGTATAGLDVSLDAFEYDAATGLSGNRIGRFRAVTRSDANGRVTATFNPRATAYRGDVQLRATAASSGDGSTVDGIAILTLVDPAA